MKESVHRVNAKSTCIWSASDRAVKVQVASVAVILERTAVGDISYSSDITEGPFVGEAIGEASFVEDLMSARLCLGARMRWF